MALRFKMLPYWVKGGIIAFVLYFISFLVLVVTVIFFGPLALWLEPVSIINTLYILVFSLHLIKKFPYASPSDTVVWLGHIRGFIISSAMYFVIGAIAGHFYGKIKARNSNNFLDQQSNKPQHGRIFRALPYWVKGGIIALLYTTISFLFDFFDDSVGVFALEIVLNIFFGCVVGLIYGRVKKRVIKKFTTSNSVEK